MRHVTCLNGYISQATARFNQRRVIAVAITKIGASFWPHDKPTHYHQLFFNCHQHTVVVEEVVLKEKIQFFFPVYHFPKSTRPLHSHNTNNEREKKKGPINRDSIVSSSVSISWFHRRRRRRNDSGECGQLEYQEAHEAHPLHFPPWLQLLQMQNGGENGGGEDKVAEEQEGGGGEADEEGHCSLLKSGQDATARIRVEHEIREQNVLAANEFIELFCDLIVARITIIAKQRYSIFWFNLFQGMSSRPERRDCKFNICLSKMLWNPRTVRKIFEKKYGRDFASAAVDLRPNAGVNRMLIDKLSVRTPSGEVKLKVTKEIAKEYQIEWDTTESEKELLKAPEELIEGPCTFVSAASLPFEPAMPKPVQSINPISRSSNEERMTNKQFEDTASAAAEAAAYAKQAIAAAEAAAFLASKDSNQASKSYGIDQRLNASSIDHGCEMLPGNSLGHSVPTDPRYVHHLKSQGGWMSHRILIDPII
ncbi:hypothetical protein Tsubulata_049987 [Turnera subulata]|uniref:Uncharacterized protein n=1 Tax=Turnera subulata TaxID=218843 RepID=A0A9Q0FB49_9ROSI|nr:hypothetical protein Tsubulata_049987 [Turnera subulata]